MKVAIFGGSFNPPTVGHMQMLRALFEDELVWKVLVVPCGHRTDKPLVSGQHRLNMLSVFCQSSLGIKPELFVRSNPDPFAVNAKVLLDDFELSVYGEMMPTSYLLAMYQKTYPHLTFSFAIGTDLLTSISRWELFEEYLRHQHFIVFKRIGHIPKPNEYELDDARILETNIKEVSSTACRSLVARFYCERDANDPRQVETKARVLDILDQPTFNYVVENNLFKNN